MSQCQLHPRRVYRERNNGHYRSREFSTPIYIDWSLAHTYERAERDVYDAHPVGTSLAFSGKPFSYSHTYDAYARMQRVLHSCCCARILLNIRSAFDRDATRSSIEVADLE